MSPEESTKMLWGLETGWERWECSASGDLRAPSDFGHPVPFTPRCHLLSPPEPPSASAKTWTFRRVLLTGTGDCPFGPGGPGRHHRLQMSLPSLAATRTSELLAAHFEGESWVKLTKNSTLHLQLSEFILGCSEANARGLCSSPVLLTGLILNYMLFKINLQRCRHYINYWGNVRLCM